jgi:hypothetical protein
MNRARGRGDVAGQRRIRDRHRTTSVDRTTPEAAAAGGLVAGERRVRHRHRTISGDRTPVVEDGYAASACDVLERESTRHGLLQHTVDGVGAEGERVPAWPFTVNGFVLDRRAAPAQGVVKGDVVGQVDPGLGGSHPGVPERPSSVTVVAPAGDTPIATSDPATSISPTSPAAARTIARSLRPSGQPPTGPARPGPEPATGHPNPADVPTDSGRLCDE